MMKWLILIGFVMGTGVLAQVRGEVVRDQSELRAAARSNGKVLGRLKKKTPVIVIGRSSEGVGDQNPAGGRFVEIEVRDREGRTYLGFVDARDLKIEELAPVAVSKEESRNRGDQHWSASLGASGSSSEGQSTLSVSGELRYLWNSWTETLFGLDLFLGKNPSLGGSLGQRIYLPVGERLKPFGQTGGRLDSFRDWDTRAGILGGGVQVLWSPFTYFEISILRYFRPEGRPDQWVFGGSSGLRF